MQKYVMEGWMAPAEGMGLGVTGKHVYLADDVDAALTQVRDTGQRIDDKLVKAEKRIAELEKALGYILTASGGECENCTSGIGSCFRNGRTPDAEYGADRCCWSCLANRTLMVSVTK